MLSRRFFRIKVLKVLFSYINSENHSLPSAERELLASIQKTYDLYRFLLTAAVAVADYAQERIDIGLQKFQPTQEEANPNMKFVNNKVITRIRNNKPLLRSCEQNCLNWKIHPAFIKKLYQNIISSDYYQTYMDNPSHSFKDDLILLKYIYANEFEDNPDLELLLEEQSAYWIDDTAYVLAVILRALDKLEEKQGDEAELFQQKRNKADEKFATTLLLHSMAHYNEYKSMVYDFLKNWEAGRVAAMDTVLIAMGLSEAKEFPNIPIKVSINEYVEIAKYYSTNNSHIFVNGILDSILQKLLSEGVIVKKGRGLVESSIRQTKEI